MNTELVTTEPPASLAVMRPDAALGINEILAQVALIQTVMAKVMHEGEHYGTIPGCGDKKTLLQPGAQKLCMTFRLAPEYTLQETTLTGGHKEYRVICRLSSIASGTFVGSGVGVCSTMEGKYRFRGGARKCPKCGKEAIIMGKKFKPADPEPGWLCWKKKDGCGATWPVGAQEIESQSIEKVEHDNPADHFNTVLKMAKKRAFVDATITATAASDIFTQDTGDPESETPTHDAPPAALAPVSSAASPQPKVWTPADWLAWLLVQCAPYPTQARQSFLDHGLITAGESFDSLRLEKLIGWTGADVKQLAADVDRRAADDSQIPGAEVPTEGQGPPASAPEPSPAPSGIPPGCQSKRITVKAKSAKPGVKKNGQPYTRHGICSDEDEWWNTFSDAIAAQAVVGQPATVWFTTSTYGNDLHAVTN